MLPADAYHQPEPGAVLALLHDINHRHGYLPGEDLRQAAVELGVPLSQIFSAASFYSAFSLQPHGHNNLEVCEGTACYLRGAVVLLASLAQELGIEPDGTTADLLFSLKRVHCVGACGLAPVMRVNEQIFGRLQPSALPAILAGYSARGEPEESP
jgi:NADP-reducing hydrogenase subunit HndA